MIQIVGIVAKFGVVVVVQTVEHVALCEPTHATPFAVKLKVTDCPMVNPLTIKKFGVAKVPDTNGPPLTE